MTEHTAHIINESVCSNCRSTKCGRNYKSILHKFKNDIPIHAKDKGTIEFVEYLHEHYYQSSGILINKEDSEFIYEDDERDVYDDYLNYIYEIKLDKLRRKKLIFKLGKTTYTFLNYHTLFIYVVIFLFVFISLTIFLIKLINVVSS